jgi:eukaryotic-like serine/threonine-protein kinase
MQYKNTSKSLKEIGNELNVSTVLEGSVRKEGNHLRIVGQLIDAKTDEHIWAESYDRELKDVFEIQSDVAQKIAYALKAKLSPTQKAQMAKQPTNNITAYDYYLKGRGYYLRYRKQDNENAIELFQKAIALDPNYALAYSALCEAQMRRPWYGFSESTAVDQAVQACNRAITIDPNFAEAYNAMQKVYGYHGWFQKSCETLKKAVELNPNYVPALTNLGVSYLNQGKPDQALPWLKKSIVLDPVMAFPYASMGETYFALDDIPLAEQYLNKSLELQPDFVYPHQDFVEIYLAQGKNQLAREQAQKALSIDPESNESLAYAGSVELSSGNYEKAKAYLEKSLTPGWKVQLGFALWKLGQKDEAEKLFQKILQSGQDRVSRGDESWTLRYGIAAFHAIHDNKPEAYRWLQQAIDAGAIYYRLMSRDPLLENLHGDAQFQKMMAQVKVRVDEMRRRAEQEP